MSDIEKQKVENALKKKPEELLNNIINSSDRTIQQGKEADRAMYVGALNIKLSERTETLSRRIYWLNFILVVLTFILVVLTIKLVFPNLIY